MVKHTQTIRQQITLQKQLTFTCSKSTIETLEKGASMFKVNNKNHRNDVIDDIVERVNVSWKMRSKRNKLQIYF